LAQPKSNLVHFIRLQYDTKLLISDSPEHCAESEKGGGTSTALPWIRHGHSIQYTGEWRQQQMT